MLKTPDLRSDPRAARILAKSIYRELHAQGYDDKQIVALATELITEVTNSISHADATQAGGSAAARPGAVAR
jgi:hypothetical protein